MMISSAGPDRTCLFVESRRLWSLLDMIDLNLKPLLDTQDVLVQWSVHLHSPNGKFAHGVSDLNRNDMVRQIGGLLPQLSSSEFVMCRKGAERLSETLKQRDSSPNEIVSEIDDLRLRILDQFEAVFCLGFSERERDLYEPRIPLFDVEVELKFPNMSEDISEAGKCLALERSTAAVFHLMRVMEIGVQALGNELGVALVAQKNWQNILDETNKAIKALDPKASKTKALAEASLHLYSVKVAWRNEVMHPKQTYTPDEAATISSGVRTFVRDLAGLI